MSRSLPNKYFIVEKKVKEKNGKQRRRGDALSKRIYDPVLHINEAVNK